MYGYKCLVNHIIIQISCRLLWGQQLNPIMLFQVSDQCQEIWNLLHDLLSCAVSEYKIRARHDTSVSLCYNLSFQLNLTWVLDTSHTYIEFLKRIFILCKKKTKNYLAKLVPKICSPICMTFQLFVINVIIYCRTVLLRLNGSKPHVFTKETLK